MNAQLKPIVDIGSEGYSDALMAEMAPLLRKHWSEIATHRDRIPLDPDFPRYAKLDALGRILCLTARLDGRLIGYSVFVLTRPGHYKSTLSALNDVIYVDPAYRKGSVGVRLIRETEKRLADVGVVKVTWHAKPGTQLAALLQRLGYDIDELMLAKVF